MSSCNNLLTLQSGFKLQGLMKAQWYTIQPGKLCLCWVTHSWLCWRAELFAANAFTTRRCEKCCSKQVNKLREICVELGTQSQRKVSTLQFIYITLIFNDADSILHTYQIAQYSALKYPIIITYMLQAVSWKILPDKIIETKTIKPKLDDATVLWRIYKTDVSTVCNSVENICVRKTDHRNEKDSLKLNQSKVHFPGSWQWWGVTAENNTNSLLGLIIYFLWRQAELYLYPNPIKVETGLGPKTQLYLQIQSALLFRTTVDYYFIWLQQLL